MSSIDFDDTVSPFLWYTTTCPATEIESISLLGVKLTPDNVTSWLAYTVEEDIATAAGMGVGVGVGTAVAVGTGVGVEPGIGVGVMVGV